MGWECVCSLSEIYTPNPSHLLDLYHALKLGVVGGGGVKRHFSVPLWAKTWAEDFSLNWVQIFGKYRKQGH